MNEAFQIQSFLTRKPPPPHNPLIELPPPTPKTYPPPPPVLRDSHLGKGAYIKGELGAASIRFCLAAGTSASQRTKRSHERRFTVRVRGAEISPTHFKPTLNPS